MKRIVNLITLLLLLFSLIGCAPAGYRFSMLKPNNSQPNILKSDTIYKDSQSFDYSDENVAIIIVIEKDRSFTAIEKGTLQYWRYPRIHLTIRNKIDKRITYDIEKIRIRRWNGDKSMVWAEKRYEKKAIVIEDEKLKRVTITTKIIDIEPQKGAYEILYTIPEPNSISLFPSPRQYPKVDFGLYLPLKIGDKTVDYNFEFQAIAE